MGSGYVRVSGSATEHREGGANSVNKGSVTIGQGDGVVGSPSNRVVTLGYTRLHSVTHSYTRLHTVTTCNNVFNTPSACAIPPLLLLKAASPSLPSSPSSLHIHTHLFSTTTTTSPPPTKPASSSTQIITRARYKITF